MPVGKKRNKEGLTDRMVRVIDAYFDNNFNQSKAMEAAGYKHGRMYAARFFRQPAVANEIERRRAKMAEKHNVTQDSIMRELAKMAFSSLGDLIEVDSEGNGWINLERLSDEQRAAVSEFTVDEYKEGRGEDSRAVKKTKIKFHDKLGALNSLARILGIFNDKLKVEGEISLAERLQRGRNRLAKEGK